MLKPLRNRIAGTMLGRWLYRARRAWEKNQFVLGTRGALLHFTLGTLRRAAWAWFRVRLDVQLVIRNQWCPGGVYFRPGSTDWRVFRQIFIDREYEPLCNKVADVQRIIDLGANVGYSAVYFLEKYPEAVCVCVEPDARNFEVLLKNTLRYGERVKCRLAAIWSSEGFVALEDDGFIGKEWGVKVHEAEAEGGERVCAMTIKGLLDSMGWDRVDILKVDVEGAEREILRKACEEWIEKVRSVSVELHDSESEALFESTFPLTRYDVFESGELAIAVRRGDGSARPAKRSTGMAHGLGMA